ncbi:hypothetical protein GALL_239950 [mine drainage metagenome]|uniref:Uncharacterized protein n=1 Tax=mine drainage metagenome TaxID=410659 RepID=A0A1J5RFD3_9ZZZZ
MGSCLLLETQYRVTYGLSVRYRTSIQASKSFQAGHEPMGARAQGEGLWCVAFLPYPHPDGVFELGHGRFESPLAFSASMYPFTALMALCVKVWVRLSRSGP